MRRLLLLCIGLLLIGSCIDRIEIKVPDSYSSQLVVDGVITDEPGPYTVRLTKATRIEKFLEFSQEDVTQANVTIIDNVGNSEVLTETDPGVYQTKENGLRGVIGREYSIKIETPDGKQFESKPDKMYPVGEFDSLYYVLETFQPINEPTKYGLRIYVDATTDPSSSSYLRWRFTGIFEINTRPELKGFVVAFTEPPECLRRPRQCAYDTPCICCKCWVTEYEEKPHLNDNQFVQNGKYRQVEAGYVPLEYFPFQSKYRFEVKQMSLSKLAFDYWRIIKSQKEGVASLFQPPTGKTRTNIYEKNGKTEVQGLFYASAVKTKQVYVTNADVIGTWRALIIPKWDCETGTIAEDCRLAFKRSSTQKPADWK